MMMQKSVRKHIHFFIIMTVQQGEYNVIESHIFMSNRIHLIRFTAQS